MITEFVPCKDKSGLRDDKEANTGITGQASTSGKRLIGNRTGNWLEYSDDVKNDLTKYLGQARQKGKGLAAGPGPSTLTFLPKSVFIPWSLMLCLENSPLLGPHTNLCELVSFLGTMRQKHALHSLMNFSS